MSDRPGLLSRAATAAARALGFAPSPAPVGPTPSMTDATPSPAVADGPVRRFARAVGDNVQDLFAGKFFEGVENTKDVLDGGWQPKPGYSDLVLEILGRTGLPQRILALRSLDATREGWAARFPTLKSELAAKASGRLAQQQKKLGAQAAVFRGLFKADQYGEAIVVMGIDDGQPMHMPLDMTRIRKVLWLKVFGRPDYNPGPLSGPAGESAENFDLPEWYDIYDFTKPALASLDRAERQPLQVRVHHTRVLRFQTMDGCSRLDAIAQALEDYFAAIRSSRRAAGVFSVAVFEISNWIAKITSDEPAAIARVVLAKLGLEKLGAIIVDKEQEKYTFQGQPGATSLPPIVDRMAANLCAWADYPYLILFGGDPAGFSTGEEVIRRYYDSVRADQRLRVERPVRRLNEILMVSEDGPDDIYVEPDDWVLWFAPLRTLSAKETAELREIVYRSIAQLKRDQIVDRDEARTTLTRDDGDAVPTLQLSAEIGSVDKPRERLEVGIVNAANTAVIEFYKARGLPPPASAERALWATVVPEIGEVASQMFDDSVGVGSLVDPATGLPRASAAPPIAPGPDELVDSASTEPAPTPGMPPTDEKTVGAKHVKERYGVTLATLKRWIRDQTIRGWRTGGDRGLWRVLESEVAKASMHGGQPPAAPETGPASAPEAAPTPTDEPAGVG